MNIVMFKKTVVGPSDSEKGQALIETTLVLVIFLICMSSIVLTQKITERSSDMLNMGLSMAITSARGATLSGVRLGNIPQHQAQTDSSNSIHAMQELGIRSSGWSISEIHDTITLSKVLYAKDLIHPYPLHSMVMVKRASSHASDPGDAARTLAQSKKMWGTPAATTRELTSTVAGQAHLTDSAWKRAKPNQDLLSGWQHIAP